MRIDTKHRYEIVLSPGDVAFVIGCLEGAAREWATCSNESEPLLTLRDQFREQALEAGEAITR